MIGTGVLDSTHRLQGVPCTMQRAQIRAHPERLDILEGYRTAQAFPEGHLWTEGHPMTAQYLVSAPPWAGQVRPGMPLPNQSVRFTPSVQERACQLEAVLAPCFRCKPFFLPYIAAFLAQGAFLALLILRGGKAGAGTTRRSVGLMTATAVHTPHQTEHASARALRCAEAPRMMPMHHVAIENSPATAPHSTTLLAGGVPCGTGMREKLALGNLR